MPNSPCHTDAQRVLREALCEEECTDEFQDISVPRWFLPRSPLQARRAGLVHTAECTTRVCAQDSLCFCQQLRMLHPRSSACQKQKSMDAENKNVQYLFVQIQLSACKLLHNWYSTAQAWNYRFTALSKLDGSNKLNACVWKECECATCWREGGEGCG